MKRRIIAWILAFMMVISGVPGFGEEVPVVDTQVVDQVSENNEAENTEIKEEPAEETPVTEEPAAEEPAEETPVTEEPVAEEPAEETPVAEEPAAEEPAEETPVTEEPATEEPAEETPVTEEPATEEPAEETPVTEEPVAEEPAGDAPVQPATSEEPQQEENTEEEQTPSADDYTLMASEKLSFTSGYAYLSQNNARVYKAENDDEVYAYLNKGVVYAISRSNAGGSIDRIRFAFATDDGVMELYVSASRLRPMSDEEIAAFKAEDEEANIETPHLYKDTYPVAVLEMTLAVVEPEVEATEIEPTPVEPEVEATETEPTPVEPEVEATVTEPTPVEPEVEATETEPTPVEPEVEATVTEPTPVEPEVEATETEPTPVESEVEATETEPTPVEPEAEATETEPTPVEPEIEATEIEPTPVEPEVEATETETTPVEPEVEATVAEPTPVEPEVEATETEPTPVEPEVEATVTEPTPVEPEIEATEIEPTPVEPEVEATETEPTPVEPEVEATETEPTPVEPEVEATVTEPTPVEPEVEATVTEPTPVEPEVEATVTEPTPVEPEDVIIDSVLSGTATDGEAKAAIDLSGTRDEIGVGEKISVRALHNGAQAVFTYTSDNANVAAVDVNGVITGVSVGEAKITVTAENGDSAVLVLTVKDAPSVIVFAEPSLIIGEDSTHKIVWSFEGDAAGAVEWFSGNELVVSVDENGVLTANGIGATAVQARAYNGAIATCAVTVMSEPSDIKLSASEAELKEGDEIKLGAFFSGDTYGKVSFAVTGGDGEAALTENNDNTVSIKALKSGSVTVTATVFNTIANETYTADCTLTIVPAPVTIVFENPRETIGYLETVSLEPVAFDGRGNVIETDFTYASSATRYVSIKGENIYGASKGSATVTVTAENGASASVKITTVSAPTKVTVNAPSTVISVGETVPFSYTLPSGQAGAVTWKVEHDYIAKVDVTGNVTAVSKGTTRIRVDTYNKKYALITITVTDAPDAVAFTKSAFEVGEGGSVQTSLTATPAGASTRATYTIVGNDALSVDENGKVTHTLTGELGKGTLRATVHNFVTGEDIYAECEIEIVPAPVTIVLENERTTIGYTENMVLDPVAYDGRGNVVETTFKYSSSNTRYISLKNGGIYGAAKGKANVTVTAANGVSTTVAMETKSAPTKVTLTAPMSEISVGESMLLNAALPSGQVGALKWTAENGSILSVDENGVVTGLSMGTTRVRVDTYNKKYAVVTIKVTNAPETLSFNESAYYVGTGCTLPTALTVQPQGASMKVTYTLEGSDCASIDENGVLTGIAVGSVRLTAAVHNFVTGTDVVAECMVNVIPGPHTIVFENSRTTIGYLETMSLNPVAYNENGDVVETEFTYKTSKAGYVSLKGESLYGKAKGASVITVTAENGASATVTITTVSAPTKVTISAESVNLAVGESTQASYAYPSGQTGAVSWKVENGSILTIDENGFVTALSKGTTRIRVDSYNKKYALLTINVVDAPESIAFEKASYQLGEGESFKPVLTALPEGASTNATYEVVGNDLVTVSENGTVTAGTTLGIATVRATVHNFVTNEDVVCECQVEIVPAPVSIEFRNLRSSIGYTENVNLEPYALDGRGNEIETTFKLTSSKTAYVSIKSGNVYGAGKGTATVTVTAANGAKREISIRTMSAPTKVTVSCESQLLAVGETMQMVASFPSGQTGAVTWKVENGEILSIDENGLVTALMKGTTRVRADSYNKKYGMLTITVADAPESIAFEKAAYQLGEGETMKPVLVATPEGTSTNAAYEIISGGELATVDSYGHVTAGTQLGKITLRATVHDYVKNTDVTAECEIEIVPAVVSIEFRNLRETIGYTENVNLEPYALDGRGNEIETTFKLTSSKTGYVSIKNGNVYGAYRGTATVTVTAANGVSTQITIKTVSAPTKVTITAPSTRISVGESMQLGYTLPSGQDGKVTWKVEDADVLNVSDTGLVTALMKGTTRVRVDTYNKKYALVTITVADAPDSISFDKAEYTVSEGCVIATSFTAQPEGASTNVKYELTGTEFASVDANGRITGILEGKATLRATVHNFVTGLDVAAECTINVVPGPASIELRNTRTTIGYLETMSLDPVAYDKNGNVVPTTFTYATSSSRYVSIKGTNIYGARTGGSSTITITAENGVKTQVSIKTISAPSKVTISAPASRMAVGETMQLTASVPNNQTGAVTWKVENAEILSVDGNGAVTALSEGTTRVRVDTYNKKYALYTVNVYPAPETVEFAKDEIEITVGMKLVPELALTPENAYCVPTYSFTNEGEGEAAVIVDGTSILGNAVGAGILTVSYTRPDGAYLFSTQKVVVKPAPATIELNAERYNIGLYETLILNPVAYDENGNEVETTFTYKTSSTYYIQLKNGGLYGTRRGSAKITVTAHNGVSATATFKVVAAPSKVTVTADDNVISQTGSTRVHAAFASGQAGTVTWISSNDNIATVDANGVVIAKSVGTVSFKATSYNGKSGICTIEVKAEPTGIAFEIDEARVGEDGKKTVKAVLPEGCAGSVTYSSANPYVATVDPATGLVTGMRQGTTVITATTINNLTGESFSDSYTLTVTPKPVRIVLNIGRNKIGLKETASLEAVAYDEFGNVTEGDFTFKSSRTAYVKVNDKGEIYGQGRSYSDITVTTYNGVTIKQRFTTVAAPTSLKFNKSSVVMSEMDVITLATTLSSGSASALKWTVSDENVVTVDEKGYVKAVAFGTAVITAETFNGKKASCEIIVKYEPGSVAFENDADKVGEGNSRVIAAAIPEDCFGPITYSSSDPDTASVDSATGKVVGLKGGKVTITASVTNRKTGETFTDTYELTVTPKPVKIEIHAARTKIGVGEIMSLEAVAYDANGQVTDGGFTYATSSTYYVKVNEAGEVYGVRTGSAYITVKTYNGVSIKGKITVVKAPTSVAINKTELRISEIDTYQLAMQLSSGSIGAYTWTSSDENVAVVDQNGLITAKGFGTADIIVTTYNGKAATCKLKVCYEPESISFPAGDITVGELASVTAKAELGDDYIGSIEYISGNENIAAVDPETGVVTGILAGETTIIAKTVNRKTGAEITGFCKVVVTPAPAKVEILTNVTTIGYKEKVKIEAITYDAAGNIIDGQLKLATSNSRYVQVNSMMEMYGAYRGSATIGVIAYNGVFASVKITVASAPASVSLNASSADLIIGKDTLQLQAKLPSGTASQITWASQDETIARIDENGLVTPVSYGTVLVRATTFNGKYKTCTVNVFEAPQSVTLSDEQISLGVEQTYVLKATLNEHAAGEITFKSSNEAIATIDASGKVTAVKQGTITITARTYNGKTDTCKVTVKPAPSKVEFTLSSITIGVKQEVDVSNLVKIPDGTAASYSFVSENKYVAKIDAATGIVTGVKVGTTRVKVTTHNGQYAIMSVVVKSAPTTLTLIIGNSKLYVGETSKYEVSLPGDIVTEYVISSSNPEIVSVDTENQQLTAVSKGKATITAQAYNGVIKTAVVEVLKHVESVSLNQTNLSLVHYDTFQLEASVLPEDASDVSVTWVSSDPEKVSVDANGLVTALEVTSSPVTITVRTKDLNLSQTCTVSVTPVRVTGIKLNANELNLPKGRMATLTVAITPHNADDRSLTWKSGNSALVTVNESGVVEALGHEGTVTITVTSNDGGFTDECVITLSRVKMEGMTLSEPSLTMIQYSTYQITPVFTPRDAEYQSLVFESLNPETVKVSESGLMEALNVGTGKVKVTVTDYFGSVYTTECTVAVVPVPVASVELSASDLEIRAGKTQEVTVTVLPDNAFNKQVKWTSDNEDAATVAVDPADNHKAVITAVSGGEAVITVSALDNGISDTVNIVVFDALDAALTPNHASNTTGNTISWTAEALNAIGDAKYTFTVVKEGAAEPVISITEFGTKNVVSIDNAEAGTYTATVTVKDSLNDTATKSAVITVSESVLFVNGNDTYTYIVLPGAAADGGDGAAIKYADPSAAPANVVIPAVVNGIPVVRIDTEAFMNATKLVKVSVPETVTVVGARAFKGCTALTDMTSHTAG